MSKQSNSKQNSQSQQNSSSPLIREAQNQQNINTSPKNGIFLQHSQGISSIQKQSPSQQPQSQPNRKINISGERAPGISGNLKADIASIRNPDGPRAGNHSAENAETFLFNKHYNKELKLCEDEIPMVLCELNESALAYLNRDQFDNALLLLQKAHGVLDVVDLSGSKRDQYIALQLFHNMAMCYQKQGQLEECALCLETTLDHLGTDYASDYNQSFAMRLYKMKIEVRLRLQFCAILSQLHRHKEAFEQALEGIKIAHLIIRDKISVTRLYSKRIDFSEIYGNGNEENIESINIDKSDNLSQSDANASKFYNSSQKQKKINQDEKKKHQQKKVNNQKDDQSKSSYPYDEEGKVQDDKFMNFQTEQSFLNNLEGSISLVEKTSKKLLPIYKYVSQKLEIIEKKKLLNQVSKEAQNNKENDQNINSSVNEDSSDVEVMINKGKFQQRPVSGIRGQNKQKDKPVKKNLNIDLRHILGFLNQTEWIQNLNIGNIMQISPIKFEDLIMIRRNEECLSRDSFLDVISFLIVGYFCASTEIRFIIQLKDEIPKFDNFQIESKTQESELWHTMSLDIACSFLPSDCPLLNHILLSYQKHHAPSQSQILENQILDEKLRVVKPLNGIDNSKFQPIVRVLQNIKIDLPYSKMVPAQKTVSKMIQEINMKFKHSQERSSSLFKQISKNALNTPSGIQSKSVMYSNQQSPNKKLNNYQQLKIKKIEQVIKKFSKEIGLEKNQVLRHLLGENKNHNYYNNHEEDFKKGIMNQISHYDSGFINNRFYSNPQLNGAQNSSQQIVRPQSQKETLSSRRNQDNQTNNNQTGIAAKIAYNNLGKSATEDANQITNISSIKSSQSQSQISTFQYKNGIGSREWTLSPQAQLNEKSTTSFPVLNSVDNSLNVNQDQEKINDDGQKNQLQSQVRSQRIQMNLNMNKTEEKQNQFEQKSTSVAIPESQKDSSLFNDINYQKINHEKSYNEQHDNGNKFILNQSDFINEIDSQQHNLSINQGGTVRQQNKRVQSKDREKVQRPRSSKGYRGNNIQLPPSNNNINTSHNSSQNNSLVQSGMNQNAVSAINIQHQQSQNHLNTQNSIQQATSLNSSSTATGPKFQANKSEERALKSQQNQRPIINKNQRQKTAGGNIANSQSSSQIQQNTPQVINKEMNIIQQNLNPSQAVQAKKLVNLTNQLVSQSSSQLPSAQITGNLTKLTKKQIQQIQQLQPLPQFQTNNPQQSSTQIGFGQASLNSNLTNYNTASQSKQNSKQKLNYDELKKLLIKDQQQQNGNLSLLNQQNSQSQVGITPIGLLEQNGVILAQEQVRGRSQNNSKPKKTNLQQQTQITQIQNQQNYQKFANPHNSQSLEKLDQIQVVLDDYLNQNLQQQIVNYQSQIIREAKDMMFVNPDINKVDFSRDSSQNQSQKDMARNKFVLEQMKMGKGAQQIQQAKKVQGQISQNQSQPQLSQQQQLNQNVAIQQSHMTQQQAQQLYLSQIQANGPIRPSSSQKYIVKSQQAVVQSQVQQNQIQNNQQVQKKVGGNQNQNITNQREQNNKSALSTIGKHQTVISNNPQQNQNQQQIQQHQQQIIQQQIIMNVNNNISGGINNISNNGQNQNNNSSTSLKRRDKARLVMHE